MDTVPLNSYNESKQNLLYSNVTSACVYSLILQQENRHTVIDNEFVTSTVQSHAFFYISLCMLVFVCLYEYVVLCLWSQRTALLPLRVPPVQRFHIGTLTRNKKKQPKKKSCDVAAKDRFIVQDVAYRFIFVTLYENLTHFPQQHHMQYDNNKDKLNTWWMFMNWPILFM